MAAGKPKASFSSAQRSSRSRRSTSRTKRGGTTSNSSSASGSAAGLGAILSGTAGMAPNSEWLQWQEAKGRGRNSGVHKSAAPQGRPRAQPQFAGGSGEEVKYRGGAKSSAPPPSSPYSPSRGASPVAEEQEEDPEQRNLLVFAASIFDLGNGGETVHPEFSTYSAEVTTLTSLTDEVRLPTAGGQPLSALGEDISSIPRLARKAIGMAQSGTSRKVVGSIPVRMTDSSAMKLIVKVTRTTSAGTKLIGLGGLNLAPLLVEKEGQPRTYSLEIFSTVDGGGHSQLLPHFLAQTKSSSSWAPSGVVQLMLGSASVQAPRPRGATSSRMNGHSAEVEAKVDISLDHSSRDGLSPSRSPRSRGGDRRSAIEERSGLLSPGRSSRAPRSVLDPGLEEQTLSFDPLAPVSPSVSRMDTVSRVDEDMHGQSMVDDRGKTLSMRVRVREVRPCLQIWFRPAFFPSLTIQLYFPLVYFCLVASCLSTNILCVSFTSRSSGRRLVRSVCSSKLEGGLSSSSFPDLCFCRGSSRGM